MPKHPISFLFTAFHFKATFHDTSRFSRSIILSGCSMLVISVTHGLNSNFRYHSSVHKAGHVLGRVALEGCALADFQIFLTPFPNHFRRNQQSPMFHGKKKQIHHLRRSNPENLNSLAFLRTYLIHPGSKYRFIQTPLQFLGSSGSFDWVQLQMPFFTVLRKIENPQSSRNFLAKFPSVPPTVP